jgi:hypothetical protein
MKEKTKTRADFKTLVLPLLSFCECSILHFILLFVVVVTFECLLLLVAFGSHVGSLALKKMPCFCLFWVEKSNYHF